MDKGPFYIPFVDFQPTLDAWHYILVELGNDTLRPYVNTVVVGLTSAVIVLILGSMAAYALVRFTYRPRIGIIGLFIGSVVFMIVAIIIGAPWQVAIASGIAVFVILAQTIGRRFTRSLANSDIAFWLISQRILPPIAVVIPLYVLFQQTGLLDTQAALIITYVATNLPIAVWLMRDYFSSLPRELEESAAVDGASSYRIFRSIVLPISVPGLVATFLIVLDLCVERVPRGARADGRAFADDAAARRRPGRDPGSAVVGDVGPDPDHDRAGRRDGDPARALHHPRIAGRRAQGLAVHEVYCGGQSSGLLRETEQRGFDRELEQPVRIVDIEAPVRRHGGPNCLGLDELSPPAQLELRRHERDRDGCAGRTDRRSRDRGPSPSD